MTNNGGYDILCLFYLFFYYTREDHYPVWLATPIIKLWCSRGLRSTISWVSKRMLKKTRQIISFRSPFRKPCERLDIQICLFCWKLDIYLYSLFTRHYSKHLFMLYIFSPSPSYFVRCIVLDKEHELGTLFTNQYAYISVCLGNFKVTRPYVV